MNFSLHAPKLNLLSSSLLKHFTQSHKACHAYPGPGLTTMFLRYDPSRRTAGAILLDEVTVINKFTPVSDSHFRLYAKPTNSFKITEKDYHYLSVFDYLQAIPVNDVNVIEFIKHHDVTNVGMFGTKGVVGIISVFTKSGEEAAYNPYVQGTLSERIMGFSSYREFYKPAYTPENIDSEKPDRRITLYWNPDITTREGRAKVSFFTSDDFSHYKVIVEGISNTGEVCLGNSEIRVASEHAKLFTR